MARVLVAGGAGYVGSATCAWLMDRGHEVDVLDDLSTGKRQLVLGDRTGGRFFRGRIGDRPLVRAALARRYDAVLHFAGRCLVEESLREPDAYHDVNVRQTEAFLEEVAAAGVRNFVFSSSCTIHGDRSEGNLDELSPTAPSHPYGRTKLLAEERIRAFAQDRGVRAVSLRYFNAAGAEPPLRVGEWHDAETRLIPKLLRAAEAGDEFEIFGEDYATPDGTALRDYVHVTDLAEAHEAALARLLQSGAGAPFEAYSLGTGTGSSVRDVLRAVERVTGRTVRARVGARRPGDPSRLVADSRRARRELSFGARALRTLDEIVESAAAWSRVRAERFAHPAIFLDRDGVLNEDPGYLSDPDQIRFFPGVIPALRRFREAGFRLVVVTNQSGVGRGYFSLETLERLHQWMAAHLAREGAKLDRIEFCIHHPDENCACRKPEPRLLLQGAEALRIDLSRSYLVGDRLSDVGAGFNAGCRGTALVRTGHGRESEAKLREGGFTGPRPDLVVDDLSAAADWILSDDTLRRHAPCLPSS